MKFITVCNLCTAFLFLLSSATACPSMFSWLMHDIAVSNALTMLRCMVLQNAWYNTCISVAVEYSPAMF